MNKSFPHQLIIPPHKIIGNHLHLTSFPRSGDCLTHPLLTMRSKIYPVKIRNILKYPFRNLPGPAILLKAILRPNDLNPRILPRNFLTESNHPAAQRSIGTIAGNHSNLSFSTGQLPHKPRSRTATLHTVLPYKAKPFRILHIRSKRHHRDPKFLHKPVNFPFHTFLIQRNHGNTTNLFHPHLLHGENNILRILMLDLMDQDCTTKIIHLSACLLYPLQNFFHKRCFRTLQDHADLNIISAHG